MTDSALSNSGAALSPITMQEVADLYRDALSGKVGIRLLDANYTWNKAYCGDVGFVIGGWTVFFFNDCDELDYTSSVVAPDGRTAEFDDWCVDGFIGCPLDLLTDEERDAMERLVEQTVS